MSKKTRNFLILAVVAVLLAASLVLCLNILSPDTQTGSKTVAVLITHSDGTEKEITVSTDGEYLWDALEPTGLFEGTESEYGIMLDTIDGEYADGDEGLYWLFTKNGEYVEYGVSSAPIADGEHYEFYTEQF